METNFDAQNFMQNSYAFDKTIKDVYQKQSFKISDANYARHIKNIFDTVKYDIDQLSSMHRKVVSQSQMIRDILTYEIQYLGPLDVSEKVSTVQEMVKLLHDALNRYQGVVGGFNMEDKHWIDHNETSRQFKVTTGVQVLANTTQRHALIDGDITDFVQRIILFASRFTDTILLDYRIVEDTNNDIFWICFIIKKGQNISS
jgi:hypothetical protein